MRLAPWIACALIACGGKHPGNYNAATASQAGSEIDQAIAAADALWEQRVDEAKLQEAIAAYEAVLTKEPTNRHALAMATRGWYFWGDGFTTDKVVQVERWGKAVEYGTQCLGQNAKIAAAITAGEKEKDAVVHAVKDDVPCLYWTATALGKWGKAQGISKTLKHLPTVKAYISKVEELEPTYFHYGPARYWGAYYAVLPSFAGQDLVKSGEYFAAANQGAEYYLPTRVLRAEFLAVATGDVKLFDADLHYVLSADPNARPDAGITPENIRDIEKAKAIFARRYELFDKNTLDDAGPAPEMPASTATRATTPAAAPPDTATATTATRPEEGATPEASGAARPPEPAAAAPAAPAPASGAARPPEPAPAPASGAARPPEPAPAPASGAARPPEPAPAPASGAARPPEPAPAPAAPAPAAPAPAPKGL